MRTRLRDALTAALKARDPVATAALRSALAAIGNAESVDASLDPRDSAGEGEIAGSVVGLGAGDVARRALTHADIERIVGREVSERRDAAMSYEALGQPDRAARLRAEADVLDRVLAG